MRVFLVVLSTLLCNIRSILFLCCNRNSKIAAVLAILSILTSVSVAKQSVMLYSPDKKLSAKIYIKSGRLFYCLFRKNNEVLIQPSALGITVSGLSMGIDVSQLVVLRTAKTDTTYAIRGKHSHTRDLSSEYLLEVQDRGLRHRMICKLFNDGFAFRYCLNSFPGRLVSAEISTFTVPPQAMVWFFDRENDWKLKSYAGEWKKATINNMSNVSSQGPVQGKPIVVQLERDKYLCITEAALSGFSGMRLEALYDRRFKVNFSEKQFDVSGTSYTPWRVVLFAETLNSLVNNDILSHLNPQPDINLYSDLSYIKPGKCVWSWLTRDSTYMKPANEMKFVNLAAELNFEYSLIDEGWEKTWPDKWKQLLEVSQYASKRNVGIWVWKHSAEIRDQAVRIAFLDSVKKSGAVGLKVDFMNSEAKPLIDFELSLLRECAERKLMVNFHGCQSPTGESRSYPNEMTREGVRGMELNVMSEGPVTPAHNAALPFTRFVVGHGDYTPGLFSNPGNTTWGHQLACMYVFDSPVLCLAENPEYILNNDKLKAIIPSLRTLPVVWDETIVLKGSSIGKLAAFARRKDRDWYLILLNGESIQKHYTTHTRFLDRLSIYAAELINDKAGAKELEINLQKGVKKGKYFQFTLEPNGGLVMKLSVEGPL